MLLVCLRNPGSLLYSVQKVQIQLRLDYLNLALLFPSSSLLEETDTMPIAPIVTFKAGKCELEVSRFPSKVAARPSLAPRPQTLTFT